MVYALAEGCEALKIRRSSYSVCPSVWKIKASCFNSETVGKGNRTKLLGVFGAGGRTEAQKALMPFTPLLTENKAHSNIA